MPGPINKTNAGSTAGSEVGAAGTDAATTAGMAGIQAQSNAGFLANTELGVQMNLQNQKNEVMEGAIMGIAKAQL